MKKKADPSPKQRRPADIRPEDRKPRSLAVGTKAAVVVDEAALLTDLRELIQSARQRIATVANSTTTLLYWHLGRRLLTENLQDGRAAYGKRILATLSRELTAEFGGGFGYATVNRAIQFAQFFPDQAIVSTLSTQLSWSHFVELLPVKDPLAREFYAEITAELNCSHRDCRWQPLRTLEEIRADIMAIEKEAEGLLSEAISGRQE